MNLFWYNGYDVLKDFNRTRLFIIIMALAISTNVQDVMRETNDAELENNKRTVQVNVDFDRLVNSVETSIMADHVEQTAVGIDPRQLLLKSNPGLYGTTNDSSHDLTNPREMYSILSYKTKSTEDLTVRFKQELVKSIQHSGLLPKLSRTNSMHDFRRNPVRSDRLSKIPFQSSLNVNEARLSNDQSVLRRNKTSVVDTRQQIDLEEKENHTFSNLPSIARNVHTSGGETRFKNNQDSHLGLPDLSADGRKRSAENTGLEVKHSRQQKRLLQIKEELSASDTKLDKWFSEMPNEVFDKAQRALMEESIKERLQNYQSKRNKRNGFPNDNVHVYVGSKVRKVPNTYLELRVDSFGKHLQTDKGDKMNKYKLHQKSIHKLKMRDIEDFDKSERVHDDVELTPRLSLHHRSLTTLALTKAKTAPAVVKHKPEVITIPTDRAMNTININESVELDEIKRDRKQLSYFEEYTERLNMLKLVSDQQMEFHMPHPNSPSYQRGGPEPDELSTDKGTAKPTIVNIALQQTVLKKRNPVYVTKTMNEKDITGITLPTAGDTSELIRENTHHTVVESATNKEAKEREEMPLNLDSQAETAKDEPKQGTIITMIPTAPTAMSSRTSTSSSIRSLAKSPLKKFNTLEVFAEHNKAQEARMEQKNYHGHKLRDTSSKVTPPTVKLDLKDYPHHVRNTARENGEVQRSEVKMQDVVFRFEPGEVFITTKKPNAVGHPNYRSSERARIIYGKALMKDEKREGKIREHSKENFSSISLGSRLDGYKSELGRFETRALEGGSVSPPTGHAERQADTPVTYVNDNGVLIRDVAIETDILGSEKSVSTKPNTDKDKLGVDRVEMRTGSGLTDFIVDDNDGESLDSASDHGGYRMNNGYSVSKHTV